MHVTRKRSPVSRNIRQNRELECTTVCKFAIEPRFSLPLQGIAVAAWAKTAVARLDLFGSQSGALAIEEALLMAGE